LIGSGEVASNAGGRGRERIAIPFSVRRLRVPVDCDNIVTSVQGSYEGDEGETHRDEGVFHRCRSNVNNVALRLVLSDSCDDDRVSIRHRTSNGEMGERVGVAEMLDDVALRSVHLGIPDASRSDRRDGCTVRRSVNEREKAVGGKEEEEEERKKGIQKRQRRTQHPLAAKRLPPSLLLGRKAASRPPSTLSSLVPSMFEAFRRRKGRERALLVRRRSARSALDRLPLLVGRRTECSGLERRRCECRSSSRCGSSRLVRGSR
jgi:hypothetical protein